LGICATTGAPSVEGLPPNIACGGILQNPQMAMARFPDDYCFCKKHMNCRPVTVVEKTS
jgi:hypothetical protein